MKLQTNPIPVPRMAFTLIELVVTIAVIAVLACALLPVLANSRTQSSLAVCLANQQQFARAWTMFGGEHSDYMPSAATDNSTNDNQFSWRIDPHFLSTAPLAPAGQSPTQFYDRYGFQKGAFYPYLKNADVIHCPADDSYLNASKWCSYSMVDNMNGSTASGIDYRVHKTTEVKHPAERMVINEEGDNLRTASGPNGSTVYELLGTWEPYKPGGSSDAPNPSATPNFSTMKNGGTTGWYDVPAALHDSGATFSFCDGHAEFHQWQNTNSVILALHPSVNGLLNQHFSAAPTDLTWVYSHIATPVWP